MQVTFSTVDFGDEAASLAAGEAGQPLEERDHIYGTVVLEAPGTDRVSIYDDLPFLLLSLCVEAPAALERAGQAEVRPIDWPGTYVFQREGEVIHLLGTQGENVRFPSTELVAALRDCGQRFAGFLENVAQTVPQFEERAQMFRGAVPA